MIIVHGHSERLAEIAKNLIPNMENGFGQCQALGVATGLGVNDTLEAVCVYHEYQPQHRTCMVSMAAFTPRWAQRGIIRALLSVPFRQYDVIKLWAITGSSNKRCQKFLIGIGFKQEAVLAHHLGKGEHAIVFRMFENEFKKRYEKT